MGMLGLRDVLVVAPAASFHPHHHHDAFLSSAEHPIIPLLTAAPCLVDSSAHHEANRGRIPTGIHLWQNHPTLQPPQNPNPNSQSTYFRKPMPMPMPMPDSHAAAILNASVGPTTIGVGFGGEVGGGSSSTCQDCGNQAKKDCSHRRCRTCCKSRGLDCSTHVKSTWVPVARRRERQGSLTASLASGSSASTTVPKKPRLVSSHFTTTASHTSTSDTTPPRSFDTSSSHIKDASFRDGLPGQVTAPAVFKCVRVTSVDDGEDEYAYQAMVRIAGHVFKGFLYDQGLEERDQSNNDNGSNTNKNNDNNIPNISELHLGGGGQSDVYASHGSGGGLMGSTVYGNPIN